MEIANELHPIELQALQFIYCMHAAELRRLRVHVAEFARAVAQAIVRRSANWLSFVPLP